MEDVIDYLLKSSSINFPGIWAPWTWYINVCHSRSRLISQIHGKVRFFPQKFTETLEKLP